MKALNCYLVRINFEVRVELRVYYSVPRLPIGSTEGHAGPGSLDLGYLDLDYVDGVGVLRCCFMKKLNVFYTRLAEILFVIRN